MKKPDIVDTLAKLVGEGRGYLWERDAMREAMKEIEKLRAEIDRLKASSPQQSRKR
jgi:hypothetical protein